MQDDEITTSGDLILVARNTGKAGRLFGKADAPKIILQRWGLDNIQLIVPFPFKN